MTARSDLGIVARLADDSALHFTRQRQILYSIANPDLRNQALGLLVDVEAKARELTYALDASARACANMDSPIPDSPFRIDRPMRKGMVHPDGEWRTVRRFDDESAARVVMQVMMDSGSGPAALYRRNHNQDVLMMEVGNGDA